MCNSKWKDLKQSGIYLYQQDHKNIKKSTIILMIDEVYPHIETKINRCIYKKKLHVIFAVDFPDVISKEQIRFSGGYSSFQYKQ